MTKRKTALAQSADERVPEGVGFRRCIIGGASLPKAELVRFVVDPEGRLAPDLAGTLPGRGLWVEASRQAIEQARKSRAFARAARADVAVHDDLADRVERLLAARCLDFIGLARRAGQAIAGYVAVEKWLRAGKVGVLLAARDGGAGGRARLADSGVTVIDTLNAAELGAAFMRVKVAHGALGLGALAESVRREARRLAGFRGEVDFRNQTEFHDEADLRNEDGRI